ncbi:unnamed protein product [Ixodes pacificus]
MGQTHGGTYLNFIKLPGNRLITSIPHQRQKPPDGGKRATFVLRPEHFLGKCGPCGTKRNFKTKQKKKKEEKGRRRRRPLSHWQRHPCKLTPRNTDCRSDASKLHTIEISRRIWRTSTHAFQASTLEMHLRESPPPLSATVFTIPLDKAYARVK